MEEQEPSNSPSAIVFEAGEDNAHAISSSILSF